MEKNTKGNGERGGGGLCREKQRKHEGRRRREEETKTDTDNIYRHSRNKNRVYHYKQTDTPHPTLPPTYPVLPSQKLKTTIWASPQQGLTIKLQKHLNVHTASAAAFCGSDGKHKRRGVTKKKEKE